MAMVGRCATKRRATFYARRKKLSTSTRRDKSADQEQESPLDEGCQPKRYLADHNHAQEQGVATIKVESLEGIERGRTHKSWGFCPRKTTRQTSWEVYQLTQFISTRQHGSGSRMEMVDFSLHKPGHAECKHRIGRDRV